MFSVIPQDDVILGFDEGVSTRSMTSTRTPTTASLTPTRRPEGDISPQADGSISFTVETDDDTTEQFAPVIYGDGADNTRLEIDEDGEPTEDFGVGGAIQTVPDETDFGDFDVDVASFDTEEDFFVGDDDGDMTTSVTKPRSTTTATTSSRSDGANVTLDEFESVLRVGGQVPVATAPMRMRSAPPT